MNFIFDFDGTLMDTAPLILATMRGTIKELDLPERTEAQCRSVIGLVLDEIPRVLFPEDPAKSADFPATYRRVFKQLTALQSEEMLVHPFPHVLETLQKLHEEGCPMAIATSRSRQSLEDFLNNMHIRHYFSMLVAGGDVAHPKPSPEPVLTILNAMGWKAEETLVVGDAAVDIQMGNAAGAFTCGVTYGNGTRQELTDARADFLTDDFCEILNRLPTHFDK